MKIFYWVLVDTEATILVHNLMFYKIGVLKNFAKFTGKHLHRSLVFSKVANFIKNETSVQVFSCKFCEIFKDTYFYRASPVPASVASQVYGNGWLSPWTWTWPFADKARYGNNFIIKIILSFYDIRRDIPVSVSVCFM